MAAEHYLQVTEKDFQSAAQNPAQYAPASPRKDSQVNLDNLDFPSVCETLRDDADACMIGKLPGQDSNLDKENQNLLCYRYTTG